MTQVDFYVTRETGPNSRLSVAARLVEKAMARGHRLFLHVDTESEARQLDDWLWRNREASFIPHALADNDSSERVVIGWGQQPGSHDDVLINLSAEIPAFFSRFHRVAEVVTNDPNHLEAMRSTWRYYRDRGYPLKKHDL